jgi:UDP-N-acetylglucosamine--N-acetylmuramyl-(pentapeptide) pyrophosphoryl-undecaprenol N-acetylglucosamine transferase
MKIFKFMRKLMKKTIFLAAGGTGGHIYPAVSLAKTLTEHGAAPKLITDQRGKTYADGVDFFALPLTSLHRSGLGMFRSIFQLAISFYYAFRQILDYKPAVIVGFGGYTSAPTLLAGLITGTPLVLFEADSRLGLVNRWFKHFAKTVAVGTPCPPYIHTGMPLRPAFKRDFPAYSPPKSSDPINILIVGGSQGAKSLSTLVPQALSTLSEPLKSHLNVAQQARQEYITTARTCYESAGINARVDAFFHDMVTELSQAHLVITRAGASTLSEIACVGRPAILVPYIHGPDNHQTLNALHLEQNNAAWHFSEKDLNFKDLGAFIEQILTDSQSLIEKSHNIHQYYKNNASERLADLVLKII